MGLKYILTLRQSSSPHLYLDQIKKMIENDEYLLPAMRGYLGFMKKMKRNFIQLPLQSEVIISPEFKCNLTRGLSPQLTEFNISNWTETDTKKYNDNSLKFINDIKQLYQEMGYEIKEQQALPDEMIKKIIDDFEKKKDKFQNLTKKDK